MYIPKHFEETEKEEIYAFVESNALGQLTSQSGVRLIGTHIPFLLSDDRTKLLGHMAKQNPQLQGIEGQEILVTLQGAHDYISPSWYTGAGVPTWNYQAVHIYGECRIFDNADELHRVVAALTEKYESKFAEPWQANYNPAMLGAIVGIEISISEIQCKYKLSQNRSKQEKENIIEQLKAGGSVPLAEAMKRNDS